MSILSARRKKKPDQVGEEHWISVSDLMSALMMIFLLLSVFYMIYLSETTRLEDLEQRELIAEAGGLADKLAVAETAVEEKTRLLADVTADYQEQLARAGKLEGELAHFQEQLAEKTRLIEEATGDRGALFAKTGDLEARLTGAEKLLGEKSRLLTDVTADYQEQLARAGELEGELADIREKLAQKTRLFEEATGERGALFAKAGDLEARLTGAEKLLGEKSRLLTDVTTDYQEQLARAGELEGELADIREKLAQKTRLFEEATGERGALFAKAGDLEARLTGAEKLLGEKSRLLTDVTTDYQEQLARAGELEGELADIREKLAQKTRLMEEATSERGALFAKAGDLEARLTGAEKLLGEKTSLLAESEARLQAALAAGEEKTRKLEKFVSQAVIYEDVIEELQQSLLTEFGPDFATWNAELREDLTFRFNEPTVLFDIGKTTIKPKFKRILEDFFPRYIAVITSDKFKNDIAEVRIEGHTSSFWGDLDPNSEEAYFNNMRLSQGRSRNTLEYVTQLPAVREHIGWLRSKLTANGLSSSKLVDNNGYFLTDRRSNGIENSSRSQRVEFRVRIDAESKITKIIGSGKSE